MVTISYTKERFRSTYPVLPPKRDPFLIKGSHELDYRENQVILRTNHKQTWRSGSITVAGSDPKYDL